MLENTEKYLVQGIIKYLIFIFMKWQDFLHSPSCFIHVNHNYSVPNISKTTFVKIIGTVASSVGGLMFHFNSVSSCKSQEEWCGGIVRPGVSALLRCIVLSPGLWLRHLWDQPVYLILFVFLWLEGAEPGFSHVSSETSKRPWHCSKSPKTDAFLSSAVRTDRPARGQP